MTGKPLGPFETEAEARAAAQAAADPGLVPVKPAANRKLLGRACEAASIEMGRYDDRILAWLSGWEPQTCAVIAGLISRAQAAGPASSAGDAQRLDRIRGLLARFDWEHDDRQLVLEAIERIADGDEDQAGELDDLEPYCTGCGADVGIFIGHGDAWLHYTGEGTAENPVELYDAGHAPDVGWRPAGGVS